MPQLADLLQVGRRVAEGAPKGRRVHHEEGLDIAGTQVRLCQHEGDTRDDELDNHRTWQRLKVVPIVLGEGVHRPKDAEERAAAQEAGSQQANHHGDKVGRCRAHLGHRKAHIAYGEPPGPPQARSALDAVHFAA